MLLLSQEKAMPAASPWPLAAWARMGSSTLDSASMAAETSGRPAGCCPEPLKATATAAVRERRASSLASSVLARMLVALHSHSTLGTVLKAVPHMHNSPQAARSDLAAFHLPATDAC